MAINSVPIDPMAEKAASRPSLLAPSTPIMPTPKVTSAAPRNQGPVSSPVTAASGPKTRVYIRRIA